MFWILISKKQKNVIFVFYLLINRVCIDVTLLIFDFFPYCAPGCKQMLKNETKQSGPKSEYALNQGRSGALLWLTCFNASLKEPIRRFQQIKNIMLSWKVAWNCMGMLRSKLVIFFVYDYVEKFSLFGGRWSSSLSLERDKRFQIWKIREINLCVVLIWDCAECIKIKKCVK